MENSIPQTKSKKVLEIFNDIAPVYDLLNNIMSWGMHMFWKKQSIKSLTFNKGDKVLDLCCGSGDISEILLELNIPELKIYAVDFSPEMLKKAQNRFENISQIEFLLADAMKLPFENDYFDKIIISFGLRNLESIEQALIEFKRVLNKSGQFMNIDFGKPHNGLFKFLFKIYFHYYVPILGKFFKQYTGYNYLPSSIDNFPSPDTLVSMMQENGFENASNTNLFMGFVAFQKANK